MVMMTAGTRECSSWRYVRGCKASQDVYDEELPERAGLRAKVTVFPLGGIVKGVSV